MEYEKIYQTYYMKIYSYAMTLVKSPDKAEEITQETFYRVMKKKNSFCGESEVFTYLCSIAKNLAMDIFRKEKKQAEFIKKPISHENIEKNLADKDFALRVHLVLHHLKEPYKEVFQLRCFGELSFKDIGLIFGKSDSWARVTYHRAKLIIREEFEE